MANFSPQKLREREAFFQKSHMAEREKEKWIKVFVSEMISSEDSDSGSNSDTEQVLIVKPLPWRAERVAKMFRDLDGKISGEKTAQAQRQRRKRILGTNASSRSPPSDVPLWHSTID